VTSRRRLRAAVEGVGGAGMRRGGRQDMFDELAQAPDDLEPALARPDGIAGGSCSDDTVEAERVATTTESMVARKGRAS